MRNILSTLVILLVTVSTLSAQSVLGKWKTVDDKTGKAKSIVEIYETEGKIYGKIVKLINPVKEEPLCDRCEGADKDKPILGMVIIRGLKKDGDEYNGGEVLNPINGTLYKCYIELEEANKLKVRGYLGFSLFGRTQQWLRAE